MRSLSIFWEKAISNEHTNTLKALMKEIDQELEYREYIEKKGYPEGAV